MAWDDLDEREYELKGALARFDWESADKICESIIDRLPAEDGRFPENKARSFLQALRRKRRFRTMGLLAQGFLESGLNAAQIRRQYGQALIDQGMLNAAKSYLEGLINDPGTN